jgi:hypothetical protein
MSIRTALLEKVFGGQKDPLSHVRKVAAATSLTTPATTTAMSIGEICLAEDTGDFYICTVITGTWVKINA